MLLDNLIETPIKFSSSKKLEKEYEKNFFEVKKTYIPRNKKLLKYQLLD